MSKKKKALKIIFSIAAVILAAVIVIAGVLFFPLMGEKHTEVWAKSDEFDIGNIQTVEKNPDEDFKILLITDSQLWMNPKDNKACYEQIKALAEQTQPDMLATVGDNVSGVTSRFLTKEFIKVTEKNQLKKQLEEFESLKKNKQLTMSRLDEIYSVIDLLRNHPITYDDQIVREILECVVVESKDRIKVVFQGGIESIMHLQNK